jgi:multidrug efflux system membrane fusion protein
MWGVVALALVAGGGLWWWNKRAPAQGEPGAGGA